MTDSSSLANALSEPLRQPFWWAALASVGLHGVLGVGAPTISNIIYGGNSSKNIPGSVGLVELTSAEAGRLPQTIPPRPSNTPFSLVAPVPLLASPKLAPPLPPAPPAINLPALPPGMPPPGFFAPLDPPLPPLTAPTAPLPQTPPPSLKPPSQKTLPFIPFVPPGPQNLPTLFSDNGFNPNIAPRPPLLTPDSPLPGGLSLTEAELRQRIQDRVASGQLKLEPIEIVEPQYPGRSSGFRRVPTFAQKDQNKRNRTAKTSEELAREQQLRNQQPKPQGTGNSNSRTDPDKPRTTFLTNYVAMFDSFKQAYPDLQMTALTPVTVPYPVAACSQKLEGEAVFGAFVNPEGLISAEPRELALTGDNSLGNAAKTAITATRFPAASTHKLYSVTVKFKYDPKICGGIPAATPSAEPAPASTPAATPLPLTAPAPTPAATPLPLPAPARTPAATPLPLPAPAPTPAATPSAEPAPTPATPLPSAEPVPAPTPVATPSAEPAPTPATPLPSAEPAPAPTPAPPVN